MPNKRNITCHLERIRCIDEADGPGKSEPYLWTVFLRVDGEDISQHPDDPFRLTGTPTYKFGQGSHRNLGNEGFGDGDERNIPISVGFFGNTITPIVLNLFGTNFEIPGICAVITVLMEEDNVSDNGAEAGHQALNNLIETSVNGFVASLELSRVYIDAMNRAAAENISIEEAAVLVLKDKFQDLKEQLVDNSRSVIRDAIVNEQNIFENIWSWVNADDFVDAKMVITTTDELLANNREETFSERYNDGDGDYRITGKFTLSAPIIPIGELPPVSRLEIQSVSKRFSAKYQADYITYVGGVHDGVPWIVHKYTGAQLEHNGIIAFYTTLPNGSETEISAVQHPESGSWFLRTHPNDTTEDNLLSLPELSFYYEE